MKNAYSLLLALAALGIGAVSGARLTHETLATDKIAGPTAEPAAQSAQMPKASAPTPQKLHDISGWAYSTDNDQMRGTVAQFASIRSTNSIDFDFPYGVTEETLLIRQRPSDGLSVILQVNGQFLCNSYSGDTIGVKFDAGPVRTFHCSEPDDGTSKAIFVHPEPDFVAALKRAKSMIVETQFYQHGRQQFTFDVEGLIWPQK